MGRNVAERKQPTDSRVQAEVDTLREVIREAHEAVQGVREAIREARQAQVVIAATVEHLLASGLVDEVHRGMAKVGTAIEEAIKKAEAGVDRRFDTISDLLLGKPGRDSQDVDLELVAYVYNEIRRIQAAEGRRFVL